MRTVFIRMLARMTRTDGLHTMSLLFFALALTVFVFAAGNEPARLSSLIPGIVWAVLLLSSLLGGAGAMAQDAASGTLDDYILSPLPLPAIMAAWMLAHAAAAGLPAAIAGTLCAAAMTPYPPEALPGLLAGLALGGLSFSSVGLLGAVLTLGSRRAAALQTVIVMPLCVPPLIFGAGAASAPLMGVDPSAPLFLLAAFACAALTLAPFAAAAILRMKVTTP